MSLRMALLGLLTVSGPSSGYDLTKLFERSINHAWQARHSQIYPELAKMADGGLVVIEEEGPRGRKTYAITEEGSRLLREWLLAGESSRSIRDELALRAFLLPTLEPEDAVAVLREAVLSCDAKLDGMEAIRRAQDGKGFGRYALELGMRQTRMFRDWAEETAEEIERSIRS
ncbi:PadR family transcriptional regulator [Planomonospora venezuelensis]|uniref:DNA-binding PadR family transcriptional regulator n=1 Tax=Planomonospora venezuelensis TaxID=1999 RepID=A0A841D1I7_PLAVE|nr:PadR family transcriptional regulator [Planomonospora venezuelensis]MBB5962268.1 DNA-binding PadR family transcriptional regulator [Planomonospora venezuelensis]GIN01034.1 PadR family transcriptional regulator [Planomonospora venezuelensis]